MSELDAVGVVDGAPPGPLPAKKRIVDRAAFLGLLAALYFSQGLPFGFLTKAVPYELRQSGRSLTFISLTTLLYLPWLLKFLWAPLVDRVFSREVGRRRSWILPLQGGLVAALLLAARFDMSGSLVPLMACIALIALLSATQDIAVDGLAVDRLGPEDRGIGNGIQYSGYRLGMIAGGTVLLVMAVPDEWGWSGALAAQAAAVLAIGALAAAYREPPAARDVAAPGISLWDTLTSFVRQPGAWLVLAFILLYKLGDSLAGGIVTPFLVDSGLSRAEVAKLGLLGSGISIAGALVGGWLMRAAGRMRVLFWLAVIHGGTAALYGLASMVPMDADLVASHREALAQGAPALLTAANNPRWGWLLAATGAEHLLGGMATAALFTFMMDLCSPRDGGTQYTLQASVVVGCQLLAASTSGALADSIGVTPHFFVGAALCLAPALLLPALRRNPLVLARLPRGFL